MTTATLTTKATLERAAAELKAVDLRTLPTDVRTFIRDARVNTHEAIVKVRQLP